MKKEVIYLDNAASTKVDERVVEVMKPYFFKTYAVATSEFAYSLGIDAREALNTARKKNGLKINSNAHEIYFMSGGTEASNLAIKGVVKAKGKKRKPYNRFKN
ncbi:MAG: aminotransferase class V-fold PLP-dependent enzyme [Asgard group archaeon]|nr:aminotransferase class V-fold PLP-dependent enzyme [Asgard group archaeon]